MRNLFTGGKSFTLLPVLFFTLASCASLRRPAPYSTGPNDRLSFAARVALAETENEILEADADLEASPAKSKLNHPRIPIEINEDVRRWIGYFAVKDKTRFQRFLQRGSVYQELVQDILRKNGIPADLYYLAMIESGYATHARSSANAVGVWQFIRGTGLQHGLKQNRYVDERRDVIRATRAAASYLKSLHAAFGSWYLAMAAYNAGEGRILRAVMHAHTKDFWELADQKALPPETRNYVPKFLAAVIIGRHPAKYGFSNIKATPYPAVEPAKLAGGVPLRHVARITKIPLPTLKRLNPHLLRGVTPPHARSYALWVPKGKARQVASAAKALAKTKIRPERRLASVSHHRPRKKKRIVSHRRPRKKRRLVYHRVRPGEALIPIAQKYGVSVKKIKRLNDLDSSTIYVGQRLLVRNAL
jgi:membrane-bound lytic murein transglycosylase D